MQVLEVGLDHDDATAPAFPGEVYLSMLSCPYQPIGVVARASEGREPTPAAPKGTEAAPQAAPTPCGRRFSVRWA